MAALHGLCRNLARFERGSNATAQTFSTRFGLVGQVGYEERHAAVFRCALLARFHFCYTISYASFESVVAGFSTSVHGRCGRKDPRKPRGLRATIMAYPRGKPHRLSIATSGCDGREGKAQAEFQCASVGAKTRSVERGNVPIELDGG